MIGTRQRVVPGIDFQWSEGSWTHNVFRVYELIFGRRYGIKAEIGSSFHKDENGKLTINYRIYSFEGFFAFWEGQARLALRSLPRPKIVKVNIPVLAFAGFQPLLPNEQPYLFAIAFDAVSSGEGATFDETVTIAHTITGSNTILVSLPYCSRGSGSTISTNKYNAVDLTRQTRKVTTTAIAPLTLDSWYLVAPTAGTNNLVIVTTSPNTRLGSNNISYTGVAQTSTIGASGDAEGTDTAPTVTITTDTNNSYVVSGMFYNDTPTPTISGSMTQRSGFNTNGGGYLDSGDQLKVTAGSTTSSWTLGSSLAWVICALEIHVAAGGGATLSTRKTLLGVGL